MREAWYVPYQPTRLEAERVLVLAPHADDEVFGCGGSLAKLAAAGAAIEVVIISQDTSGNNRLAESTAAAVVLGYPAPTQWDYADRGLETAVPALIEQITEHLERLRPTLLFAPSAWEMHPDHRATCDAALQAGRRYATARRQRGDDAGLCIALYEIGLPLAVTDFIDITPHWALKREAMQCFTSQLAEQRYAEQIAGLNIYRSYTLGKQVVAAEALHLLNAGEQAPWPPLPSQQDVALWRCEATLARTQQHAEALARDIPQTVALQQALTQSQAETRDAQAILETIYATRGWRWLSRLKRLLKRD